MRITTLPEEYEKELRRHIIAAVDNPKLTKKGRRWYTNAHNELRSISKQFTVSMPVACAITARLSPSISWDRNLIATANLLEGKELIDGYPNNVRIARDIRDGKWGATRYSVGKSFPVNARKIFSFYDNLLLGNQSQLVTVDRWMIRACFPEEMANGLDGELTISSKVYHQVSHTTSRLASYYRLWPAEIQAMIWLNVREEWNLKSKPETR